MVGVHGTDPWSIGYKPIALPLCYTPLLGRKQVVGVAFDASLIQPGSLLEGFPSQRHSAPWLSPAPDLVRDTCSAQVLLLYQGSFLLLK